MGLNPDGVYCVELRHDRENAEREREIHQLRLETILLRDELYV